MKHRIKEKFKKLSSTVNRSSSGGRWQKEEIERLVELSSKGYSYQTIANILGRSENSVACKLSRYKASSSRKIVPETSAPRRSESDLGDSVRVELSKLLKVAKQLEDSSSTATLQIENGELKVVKFQP